MVLLDAFFPAEGRTPLRVDPPRANSRRAGLLHVGLFTLASWLAAVQPAHAFSFDDVAARARADAQRPYQPPPDSTPAELKALDYDGYRDIRFRPEQALWRRDGLPFQALFFHLGHYQVQPVVINEITPDGVRHIPFDRQAFDYGKNTLTPSRWPDLGFAGFRLIGDLNTTKHKDELIVFLGASYFRALGRNQQYGLSARGLAIDTVGGKGEEFPRFKEFWVQRPDAKATDATVYALLDSPRATGAYQFTVRPGDDTVIDVRARLYLRAGVATLAIAPLTSMYQHGENEPHPDEFRPEVHDSDGLMVATGDGEWLWRPLINPGRTLTTSFSMRDPKGFGLMQRDRDFASYQDLEAHYERRPSAWVEPRGNWGAGRVELMQFHTADETNDNVVAYWVPARQPAPGEPLDVSYALHWQGDKQQHPPGAWTVATRRSHGGTFLGKDEYLYVVDFVGPSLIGLPEDAPVEAMVTVGNNGRLVKSNAYRNSESGGWRLTARVKRANPAQPVELRAYLKRGSDALTETWTTVIPAD